MPALPCQMCCLSLIEMCGTICLNGIVPRKCTWFISCQSFALMFFPSPCNPKELFNLRHASACNVIEQIFGILKWCFRIFHYPPEYDMSVQALIPPALAALHNFIWQYDPEEIHMYDDDELIDFEMDPCQSTGVLGTGPATPDEMLRANERQDRIAGEMWAQYQHYLRD